MAQPGEARTAPNARVATIQKRLVDLARACVTLGVIALLISTPFQRVAPLWTAMWRVFYVGLGLSALIAGTGRGILLYLRPNQVIGQLAYVGRQLGMPRVYALTLIWSGLVWGTASVVAAVLSHKPSAIIGSGGFVYVSYAGLAPSVLLISYLWIRRLLRQQTPRGARPA